MIDFTVDGSPTSRAAAARVADPDPPAGGPRGRRKPDVVLILPWNLRDEIVEQHAYVRDWGGRFAVLSPAIGLIE